MTLLRTPLPSPTSDLRLYSGRWFSLHCWFLRVAWAKRELFSPLHSTLCHLPPSANCTAIPHLHLLTLPAMLPPPPPAILPCLPPPIHSQTGFLLVTRGQHTLPLRAVWLRCPGLAGTPRGTHTFPPARALLPHACLRTFALHTFHVHPDSGSYTLDCVRTPGSLLLPALLEVLQPLFSASFCLPFTLPLDTATSAS